ncbi:unnamed protein product [Cylicostephanus goldi]|uniref:Uncharacterized protein n=1 Tax=Cylicostephanus goldi TaxID=71465 RepID=A0A3P7PV49_CYLGO|nr:unnamed protein product [Cylicostephanus goldi]
MPLLVIFSAVHEALSLFSDKRTQFYEEELKVARLKQNKLQVEIQVAELRIEGTRMLPELHGRDTTQPPPQRLAPDVHPLANHLFLIKCR